eukprot:UN09946
MSSRGLVAATKSIAPIPIRQETRDIHRETIATLIGGLRATSDLSMTGGLRATRDLSMTDR